MIEPMNPTVIWKFLTPKVGKFWNLQREPILFESFLKLFFFLFFKGFHQRTIQLKDLKPSGICLVEGKLYLADVLKKVIVCFNITDT